jgi:uracil-DNA glycosylase
VFMYPLFHPAAALRTPAVRQQLEQDFQGIPPLLEQQLPEPSHLERPVPPPVPEPTPPPIPEPNPPVPEPMPPAAAPQLGLF